MDFLWSVEGGLVVAAALAVILVALWVARRLRSRGEALARAPEEQPPQRAAPSLAPPAKVPRLRAALAKSRDVFRQRLELVFRQPEADGLYPALEEALVSADVGIRTASRILERVRRRVTERGRPGEADLRRALLLALEETLGEAAEPVRAKKPWVILVAGVNGVGKTTSIGKLAARYRRQGFGVLLVAADTFRAAAIDQLGIWAERVGADFVRHQSGSDPGAVAYDGVQAAISRGTDVVLVDTAGRLHTRENLMEEIRKVNRVIGKALPGAPHEVLLVLDATTGQNAVSQARVFTEALGVTGIVLSKLDGTAKGGAVLAIREELGIPIRYVGVGEGVEDLRPFSAVEFAAGLVEPAGGEDEERATA